jgi:23S rRNA (cytidine1920-2'-O)/16S rRNA (cytidine1409-2'-O)-methyltransferase
VGPGQIEKGGVVRDAVARQGAIDTVRDVVVSQGLVVEGVIDSPTPGPAGNVEALLVARRP